MEFHKVLHWDHLFQGLPEVNGGVLTHRPALAAQAR